MFCTNCGAKLEEGSKFCNNCGHPVVEDLAEGGQQAKHVRNSRMVIISFVSILVPLAIGVFVVYAHFANNGTSTALTATQSSTAQQQAQGSSTVLGITSVNPAIVLAPFQNIIAINGTGFEGGATVEAMATDLDISGVIVSNLMYVKYPGNFAAGKYDITVINPDGGKVTLPKALTIEDPSSGSNSTAQSQSTELSSAGIISKIAPSVVLIRTNLGCGSGMIVSSNGTILTDDHVISGTNSINVYLSNGAIYDATVLSSNTTEDLALIKIGAGGLPTVQFDSSSDALLPLGTPVTAIGYPLTCNQDQTLEADPGIVTARRTSAQLGANVIQTSARINPGDSGGPLVDNFGNVVGINESILTTENLDLNVTGIAFATPSEVIMPFVTGQ